MFLLNVNYILFQPVIISNLINLQNLKVNESMLWGLQIAFLVSNYSSETQSYETIMNLITNVTK